MDIIIRADGGQGIGMGHIMRTLVLATKLKKTHNITYICSDKLKFLNGINKIELEGFKVRKIHEEESILSLKADFLIIDKYDITIEYLEKLRKVFKVLCFDDNNLLECYPVDILLNQNPHGSMFKYNTLNKTKVLLGGKYSLLREEFLKRKPVNIRKEIKKILITIGGSDDHNLTERILSQIDFDSNLTINVVIGGAFNYRDLLKQSYKNKNNIIFYENAHMSKLMSECDVCIAACGSTLYELSYLGVPTIGIVIAGNQKICGDFMEDNGLISLCKIDNIYEEVLSLSYEKRRVMHNNMIELIDGKGLERILSNIE